MGKGGGRGFVGSVSLMNLVCLHLLTFILQVTYYRGNKFVTLVVRVFYKYAELQLINFSVPRKMFRGFKFSLYLRYVYERKYFFSDFKIQFLFIKENANKNHTAKIKIAWVP